MTLYSCTCFVLGFETLDFFIAIICETKKKEFNQTMNLVLREISSVL